MLLRDGWNKTSRDLWEKRHEEDYYTFPDNWHLITELEYYGWFVQESILCVERRALQKNADGSFAEGFTKGTAINATLFWISYSEGIAVEAQVGKPIRYFKFGCEHVWDVDKFNKNFVGMTCRKCGQTETVGSGD